MPVTIRPVQQADEQAWRGLWEQYNQFYERTIPEDVTATSFSRFLDSNIKIHCAVAAAESGQVVGFVTWFPHPSTFTISDVVYLNDLFVDPSTRNGGVGRQLIEHVYTESRAAGAALVYWHTQNFNHRAQLLYTKVAERTGFIEYRKTL